jgi:four helix bundle protein
MIDAQILNRNKNINRGFRKLDVWQEAIRLFVFEKEMLDHLKTVSYNTIAQIENSAFSVHSNIAEGYGRRYLKESIQFNNIALASLAENYSQNYALLSSNDISNEWFEVFDLKHYSLENKLISYNRSQIMRLKDKKEWENDYLIKEMFIDYEITVE